MARTSILTARAADAFRLDHLAVFAERLAASLSESSVIYLQTASRVLARRVGRRPGPKRLPVWQPPADDQGSEFACQS